MFIRAKSVQMNILEMCISTTVNLNKVLIKSRKKPKYNKLSYKQKWDKNLKWKIM